jgi:2-methylcitrate dehydratase PrpD
MTENITQELVAFASGLTWDGLPDEVRAMAAAAMLDWIACAVAGAVEPGPVRLREVQARQPAGGSCTVVGTARLDAPAAAAMHNGFAAHALELDDVHLPSASHATAPTLAAALAVGELVSAGPREITVAYGAGYEAMARIGRPIGLHMISRRHIHPTGFLGYFGAATAAGRLLGLTGDQMVAAWGIAGGQAGGLTEVRGTMSKAFFAGHSAAGGVLAAFDAESSIEPVADRPWEILENSFKTHASCAMSHPLIDGILRARADNGGGVEDVERIRVRVFADAATYLDRPAPADGLDARFSAQFCAAVALADGVAGTLQFGDDRVAEPGVRKIMQKVQLIAEPRYAFEQAAIEISYRDGRNTTVEVDNRHGDCGIRAPDDHRLVRKVFDLATSMMAPGDVQSLVEGLRRWPDIDHRALLAVIGRAAARLAW